MTIGNSAPEPPPTVGLALAAPGTDDDLTVIPGAATDADGDPLSYTCEWAKSVNRGANWSDWGHPGLTIDKSLTSKGDWWKAHVRASDGTRCSDWTEMAPVEVANTAPGAPATLSLSAAAPLTDDDLSAAPGTATDADGDVLTYACEWAKSTDDGATWGEWGNAGATLDRSLTAKGEQWKARARAHDGTAPGPWVESDPVTIGDKAASAPRKPVVTPLGARTDDDLTAAWAASSDPDGDAVSYAYQWLRDGIAVAGQSGTTSGLSTMLPRAQTTRGDRWSISVTAQSGSPALRSTNVTSNVVTIANTAPKAPLAAVIKPGYPRTNADLKPVVTAGTDADGDRLTYRFRWSRSTDGGHTWGAWKTTRTISRTQTRRGERWRMCVRCTDGRVWSPFRSAAPVTILNTAPRMPKTLTVSPARPGVDDNLTAVAGGSTDLDNDPLTYEYHWRRSRDRGVTWSSWAWTGPTVSGTLTNRTERWQVRARAHDGALASMWLEAKPVAIGVVIASETDATDDPLSGGGALLLSAVAAPTRAGGATVSVTLSAPAHLEVQVLNLAGRAVAVLPSQEAAAGCNTLLWNGLSKSRTAVPSGTYLLRIVARSAGGAESRGLAMVSLRR